MIVTEGKRDRRKMGRPQNPNRPAMDTTMKVRKQDLDRLDRLINYARMPLGEKFSSLLNEFEALRKNSVGQRNIETSLSNEEFNALWQQYDTHDESKNVVIENVEEGIIQE